MSSKLILQTTEQQLPPPSHPPNPPPPQNLRITFKPIELGNGILLPAGTRFTPVTYNSSNINNVTSGTVNSNALINQQEMLKLDLFFQQELLQQQQLQQLQLQQDLFDQNEQKFLSNFLDGFLVDENVQFTNSFNSSAENAISYSTTNTCMSTSTSTSGSGKNIIGNNFNGSICNNDINATSTNTADTIIPEPVPGTVPIPVLQPRKKRHQSKELLTDEEKRANHIASEQKRRQNIRNCFRALSLLIGLEPRSVDEDDKKTISIPSKSIILEKAISHLKLLIQHNLDLSNRLTNLKQLQHPPVHRQQL